MSDAVLISANNNTVIVRVPMRHHRRGGRKVMVAKSETSFRPARITTDDTILKALGRAYRWKRMLESGEFASITDLARAETINHSYIRRILRLTLLSPTITEMILNGRHQGDLQLENVLKPFLDHWEEQADRVR